MTSGSSALLGPSACSPSQLASIMKSHKCCHSNLWTFLLIFAKILSNQNNVDTKLKILKSSCYIVVIICCRTLPRCAMYQKQNEISFLDQISYSHIQAASILKAALLTSGRNNASCIITTTRMKSHEIIYFTKITHFISSFGMFSTGVNSSINWSSCNRWTPVW